MFNKFSVFVQLMNELGAQKVVCLVFKKKSCFLFVAQCNFYVNIVIAAPAQPIKVLVLEF